MSFERNVILLINRFYIFITTLYIIPITALNRNNKQTNIILLIIFIILFTYIKYLLIDIYIYN